MVRPSGSINEPQIWTCDVSVVWCLGLWNFLEPNPLACMSKPAFPFIQSYEWLSRETAPTVDGGRRHSAWKRFSGPRWRNRNYCGQRLVTHVGFPCGVLSKSTMMCSWNIEEVLKINNQFQISMLSSICQLFVVDYKLLSQTLLSNAQFQSLVEGKNI